MLKWVLRPGFVEGQSFDTGDDRGRLQKEGEVSQSYPQLFVTPG